MADLTMCLGTYCRRKEHCYRYTAPVNPWRQSYFVEVPLQEDESCVHFIPNGTEEKKE